MLTFKSLVETKLSKPFFSFVGKNDFYSRTRLVFLWGFEDKSFSREYNHTSSPLCPSNHRTLHSLQVLQCSAVQCWKCEAVYPSIPQCTPVYLNVPQLQCDAGVERCGCELVSRIKCPHFHGNPWSFSGKARVVANNDQQKVLRHAASYNLWEGGEINES